MLFADARFASVWEVNVDDQAATVTLEWVDPGRPVVRVNGEQVPQEQEPSWNRHPHAQHRLISFEVLSRPAQIEVQGRSMSLRAEFSLLTLSVDGREVPALSASVASRLWPIRWQLPRLAIGLVFLVIIVIQGLFQLVSGSLSSP